MAKINDAIYINGRIRRVVAVDNKFCAIANYDEYALAHEHSPDVWPVVGTFKRRLFYWKFIPNSNETVNKSCNFHFSTIIITLLTGAVLCGAALYKFGFLKVD